MDILRLSDEKLAEAVTDKCVFRYLRMLIT